MSNNKLNNKIGHGGKRKGAGRPSKKNKGKPLKFNCAYRNLDWCQAAAEKNELSKTLNALIDKERMNPSKD